MVTEISPMLNTIDSIIKILILNHYTSIKNVQEFTDEALYEYLNSSVCTKVVIEKHQLLLVALIITLLVVQEAKTTNFDSNNIERYKQLAMLLLMAYPKMNFDNHIGEILNFALSGQYAFEVHKIKSELEELTLALTVLPNKSGEFKEYKRALDSLHSIL